MRITVSEIVIAAAVALGTAACSGYNAASPTDAGGAAVAPADAVTINVVADNGALSFSPNPATVQPGRTVVWHNVDTLVHRVVLDNGALDTGNIAPGRFSGPMTLPSPSPYHCSIHPGMVGTIVAQ